MEVSVRRNMSYAFRGDPEKRVLKARMLDPVIVDKPGDEVVRICGKLVDPETGAPSDVTLIVQIGHENAGPLVKGIISAAKVNGWVIDH